MEIRIDDQLWAASMAPLGVLQRWRVSDGVQVSQGQAIAEVLIEDCLHEITAPSAGRVLQVTPAGTMIEPGSLVAKVER